MNTILLERIKEQIRLEPLLFNMDALFETPPEHCGTMACIGGWAICLHRGVRPSIEMEDDAYFTNVTAWYEAADVLDLTYEQSEFLFFLDDWPEEFRDEYQVATLNGTPLDQAEVACRRIDHFIETGL